MRGTKAKMLRRELGKPLPRVRAVEKGTRTLMVCGKRVEIPNWVPGELTEEEKAIKAQYRKSKKQYNRAKRNH